MWDFLVFRSGYSARAAASQSSTSRARWTPSTESELPATVSMRRTVVRSPWTHDLARSTSQFSKPCLPFLSDIRREGEIISDMEKEGCERGWREVHDLHLAAYVIKEDKTNECRQGRRNRSFFFMFIFNLIQCKHVQNSPTRILKDVSYNHTTFCTVREILRSPKLACVIHFILLGLFLFSTLHTKTKFKKTLHLIQQQKK